MEIWGVIIGAVIGSATSIISTYMNNRNLQKSQLKIENLKRNNEFKDFQLESCIKLQTTLNEFLRSSIMTTFTEESEKKDKSEEEIIDLNFRKPNVLIREINLYKERLTNKELRSNIDQFVKIYSNWQTNIYLNNEEIPYMERHNYVFHYSELSNLLGEEIRGFY